MPASAALAAVIGAIVTPTDPIAASPIVTGDLAEKHLPERLRNAISLESGANDGLSDLFVLLPFLLLTRSADEAWRHWLQDTLLPASAAAWTRCTWAGSALSPSPRRTTRP